MLLSRSSDDIHAIVKTMHDALVIHAYENQATIIQFDFDNDDYQRLELATLICGSLSIVAAFLVLLMYLHLSIYYPRDANRVSLHCVIFAIILSLVDDCLSVAALRYGLYNSFCSTFRAVDGIITLISCCLLGMVGVHLLLVFYFHVRHWPCRPEYIFFPVSICYGFIGNIRAFFANDIPSNFRTIHLQIPHVCWYYSNFIDRIYNYSSWIYYYSFLFFIIVLSFFCSLIAMHKVYRDKKENQARLVKITTRGSASSASDQSRLSANQRMTSPLQKTLIRTLKDNSDSFSTIVIRSLLYPLIRSGGSDYKFMSRLEGFFIACIFCMDPSVQKVQRKLWHRIWCSLLRRPETKPSTTLATSTTLVSPVVEPPSSFPRRPTTDDALTLKIPDLDYSLSHHSSSVSGTP